MFTPSRKRTGPSSSGRRSNISLNTTPRLNSSLRTSGTSRASLLRKSFAGRSPAVGSTSLISSSSPTVTSVFNATHHNIESYPSSLPVLITEAITQADDFSDISASLGENGWSIVVIKQQLFVWAHKPSGYVKTTVCKELRLPAPEDDLMHTSSNVCLDVDEDSAAVSVLAVTNNFHVQHWPNILTSTSNCNELKHEAFVENETCFNITSIQPYGFLVTTTTGAVYQLQTTKNHLICHQLHTPKSLMSGISRRVSSFFFTPSQESIKIVQSFTKPTKIVGEFEMLILTSNSLQQWKVSAGNTEQATMQMVNEMDLQAVLAPKLKTNNSSSSVKIWPLDVMRASRKKHVTCLVGFSQSESTVKFALCVFTDLGKQDVDIVMIEHSSVAEVSDPHYYPSYKLVIEDPSSRFIDHIAIWCGEQLILKSLTVDGRSKMEDTIPFSNSGDKLVGAGQCDGRYIFLSIFNALLTCSSSLQSKLPPTLEDSILNSSLSSTMPSLDNSLNSIPGTPVMTQARMEHLETSGNTAQKLQAAFLYFCRNNLRQAQSLVDEVFPEEKSNHLLDGAVAVVSTDLLDDYPASDPRWAESVSGAASEYRGSAGSVILIHQLQDKQNAHSMFLKFLSEVGIWHRLTTISHGQRRNSTRWLLSEHSEKLCAANNLLQKHSSHQGIVDAAVRKVLDARGTTATHGGLTAKDYFYREVSKIEEILEYLIEAEVKSLSNSSLSSHERFSIILGVNAVFEAMLLSALNYRRTKTLTFEDSAAKKEFIPWTVGSGRVSVRTIISEQHKLTIEMGIPNANDNQQRSALYQSLVVLTDLVMEGYKEQLESLSKSEDLSSRWAEVKSQHDRHRSLLIKPLLEIGQLDKAAALAEKYEDFDILIQVCEESGGNERLMAYMKKFMDQGFSEFLFKWYIEHKEYEKLLSCCENSPIQNQQLTKFLNSHPKLAWMHQIQSDNYTSAQETLQHLASLEEDLCAAKKTYLSLGKLAAVFSDQPETKIKEKIEEFSQQQELVQYQETLPAVVLESMQTTIDTMPVYQPTKLIQLYIGDVNQNANEVDFKKAFELLRYLSDTDEEMEYDVEKWKLIVWCRAILKDRWADIDVSMDPFESCSHTVLFKTLQLAHTSGLLGEIVPEVDELLSCDELKELRKSSKFEYLLRASFERIQRTLLAAS
uniref:nuclear pore complex protein Nup133-like n=1 Tax=Ciona intestinalis TaxID=7719 RepID=UPI000180C330|nr:nuclear pore complex protein Nup133-like [Ciona intestinalis]|eukprot:XP_002124857.3 nuclear pore complex protein Nup133-like [Ciona intestinalis]